MSKAVSTPFFVIDVPIALNVVVFRYALSLIVLPVPPGPGSCVSAVLKFNVMLVMFRLNPIVRL